MNTSIFQVRLPAVGSEVWDKLGMGTSALCVAHCVLTPVLLIALPLAGLSFLEDEAIHHALVLCVAILGGLAFGMGYRLHRNTALMVSAAAGLALLMLATFVAGKLWGETGETALTMLGGAIMVTSHWKNRTFCRACQTCCPHGEVEAESC